MLELIILLSVFAIIVSMGVKELDIGKKSCYIKLAHTLLGMQEQLSLLYASHTLRATLPTIEDVRTIMAAHTLDSTQCKLHIVRNSLRAEAFGLSTSFTMLPNDASSQPSFKCDFATSVLCREILLRIKRK